MPKFTSRCQASRPLGMGLPVKLETPPGWPAQDRGNRRTCGAPHRPVAVGAPQGMSVARPCSAQGQTAMVTVDDQEITVMAFPAEASALDFVMPMLKAGKIAEAVPYLESLTKSAPANAAVLYNLGISYSERRLHPPQPGRHPDRVQAHRRGSDASAPRPGPAARRSAGALWAGHRVGTAGHARGR